MTTGRINQVATIIPYVWRKSKLFSAHKKLQTLILEIKAQLKTELKVNTVNDEIQIKTFIKKILIFTPNTEQVQ